MAGSDHAIFNFPKILLVNLTLSTPTFRLGTNTNYHDKLQKESQKLDCC